MIHLLFLALVTSLTVCSADISVQNSPEDQFPLVARINNHYTWTLSRLTFGGCNALQYSTSPLKSWLSFDSNTLTFSGTPSEQDEGTTDITLTAQGCGSSKSTSFAIPVKSNPPPTLNMPIASQFTTSNPSLSSIFLISPGSALATDCPSVRIPPKWSFSIGFNFETYLSNDSNVLYTVAGADGSPPPSWVDFNPHDVTLNGVCPHELEASPQVVPLMLIASDEEGYSGSTSCFNLIVASHELSSNSVLPTINVTADADFNITLGSPADFSGILVDGETIHTSDIATLDIDVTDFSDWLKYDAATRTLAGHPPLSALHSGIEPSLPVHITTTFNQSKLTTVTLDLEPSYFISNILPDLPVGDNGIVQFDISPDCSNATNGDTIILAATYEPSDIGQYFQFDAGHLSGTIPQDLACTNMNVTLIAYDNRTHSTSHAKLPIRYCPGGHENPTGSETDHHHFQLSPSARHSLTLGLGITFGVIGGFGLLGCLLAAFRKCARVEDTALEGEEGRSGWSEKDKQWYGISEKPNEEVGYGWSEGASTRKHPNYGPLGLGLRRVQERSQSDEYSNVPSPAVMSKREFMTKIKETVRNVSDRCQRIRKPSAPAIRPVIGKPILVVEASPIPTVESSPSETIKAVTRSRSSTSLTRSPPAVHFIESLSRQPSCDSIASAQAHADEAVVHTASRAMSIRSGRSSSQQSSISPPLPPVPPPVPPPPRPCLVPFTSALRVPVPQSSTDEDSPTSSKRITSQTALVVSDDDAGVQNSGSNDELSMGLHYVCALGDDGPVNTAPSSVTMSTNMRSSFSSLPSSHEDDHGSSALNVRRMLVRTGEQFKFRVPLRSTYHVSPLEKRNLVARLVTGEALPVFLHVDLLCPKYPGAVEFYGVPLNGDAGGLEVGLYTADDVCVARLSLEILARR